MGRDDELTLEEASKSAMQFLIMLLLKLCTWSVAAFVGAFLMGAGASFGVYLAMWATGTDSSFFTAGCEAGAAVGKKFLI